MTGKQGAACQILPDGGKKSERSRPTNATGNPCCKVGRVKEKYELTGLDQELRRRREKNDATLHALASYLNERITAASLSAADIEIDAEPATVSAALQGSEDIELDRRDEIQELVAGGTDLEQLKRDYTSHETIRKHLKDHLGISTSQGSIDSLEELQEALATYEQQYENAIVSALERANERGSLAGGDFRIYSTRVECQECSSTYRLRELLSAGGCKCSK